MPNPIYMLCSESGSEDRTTGVLSHFKVIDQIELREFPRREGEPAIIPALPFQVVAVWSVAEGDDPDQEYEFKTLFYLPNSDEIINVHSGAFKFEKPRFRITANVLGMAFQGEGVFRAECKIRPIGGGDWLIQSYEIPIVVIKLASQQ
jgi:hypothetical protein